MTRKSVIFIAVLVFLIINTSAQEALKYQLPPSEIVKIVDAPQTPSISVSPDKPATVYWVEALDNGNYSNEMQHGNQSCINTGKS